MIIRCAFSSDNNYIQHLGVAITSLLENNAHNDFVLHFAHNGVDPAKLDMLSAHRQRFANATLIRYRFEDAPYQHFRLDGHITLASYFRLFLTDIIPPDVGRILYLDADIVVLGDVASLWTTDFGDALIAAAPNLFSQNNERLELPHDYCYFNAGILMIDLERWRREGLIARFVDYVEHNHARLQWHDQDVLNAVLHERVKYLDYSWNFQARTTLAQAAVLLLDAAAFAALRRRPNIVHFTIDKKPWFYTYNVPFEAEYLKYLKLTPWRSYVPPDKTAKGWITRNFPQVQLVFRKFKRLMSPRRPA
jgi:lipopolysaccharide biosynthesis glycosyltransferase